MGEIPASEFDTPSFNACEFVHRYRDKHVPLSQLHKGLRVHLSTAKQELDALISDKCSAFVTLSSQVDDASQKLKPLRAPLQETCEVTKNLEAKLGTVVCEANSANSEAWQCRARRDSLKSYIDNAKFLARVKCAVRCRRGNPQEPDEVLQGHIAHENIARDLRQIRLNLNTTIDNVTLAEEFAKESRRKVKAHGHETEANAEADAVQTPDSTCCRECKMLLEEVTQFENLFALHLSDMLRGLLIATRTTWEEQELSLRQAARAVPRLELESASYMCRALTALGRANMAEAIFCEILSQSFIDSIAAKFFATQDGRIDGHTPNLQLFFDAIFKALLADGTLLLVFAKHLCCFEDGGGASMGLEGKDHAHLFVPMLHLISHAVVIPTLHTVEEVCPHIFEASTPDTFVAKFKCTQSFVDKARQLMTPVEKQAFMNSDVLAAFHTKWKKQDYAKLRAREALHRLQAAASTPPDVEDQRSMGRLHWSISSGSPQCWLEVSSEVVELVRAAWSDKWYLDALFPHMLQLSLEMFAWYSNHMATKCEKEHDPAARGWNGSSVQAAWAHNSPPLRLARAVADLYGMQNDISCTSEDDEAAGRIARIILDKVPCETGNDPIALTRDILRKASNQLTPTVEAVENIMLQHVIAATVPPFTAIHGIPAFYRMLSRAAPTKPSPYVESAIKPIQAFRDAAGRAAPKNLVEGWVSRVVHGTALEFHKQATVLQDSTHQADGAQTPNSNNILLQLCLDVEAFTTGALKIGASTSDVSGLQRLSEVAAAIRRQTTIQ